MLGHLKTDEPWLLRLVELVRERPAMYFGDNRVSTFATWINGYCSAREDLGFPPFAAEEADLLEGFTYWLAVKYNTTISCRWDGIIEHVVDHGDRNIQTFFRLFDEYLKLRNATSIEPLRQQYDRLFGRCWSANS
jgi:hypothetical protein